MGQVISLAAYRARRDPVSDVDRLDVAVSRLDPLVRSSSDRVKQESSASSGGSRERLPGRPAEAAERAERLADQLEHPAAHG
jgi:hypothetical protein